MILFENRQDALSKLLAMMPLQQMRKEKWEVLAISEGGVPFAQGIAKAIGAHMDFLFTEPIAAPNNKECWIAVVSETEEIVINHNLTNAFDISIDYVYGEAKRKYEEKILTYLYKYRKGELIPDLRHKNIMLVDEGADTGLTLMASLKTVFAMNPTKVAVALPVIPESLATELFSLVDDAYLVHQLPNYIETKAYFRKMEPLSGAVCELILFETLKGEQ